MCHVPCAQQGMPLLECLLGTHRLVRKKIVVESFIFSFYVLVFLFVTLTLFDIHIAFTTGTVHMQALACPTSCTKLTSLAL